MQRGTDCSLASIHIWRSTFRLCVFECPSTIIIQLLRCRWIARAPVLHVEVCDHRTERVSRRGRSWLVSLVRSSSGLQLPRGHFDVSFFVSGGLPCPSPSLCFGHSTSKVLGEERMYFEVSQKQGRIYAAKSDQVPRPETTLGCVKQRDNKQSQERGSKMSSKPWSGRFTFDVLLSQPFEAVSGGPEGSRELRLTAATCIFTFFLVWFVPIFCWAYTTWFLRVPPSKNEHYE